MKYRIKIGGNPALFELIFNNSKAESGFKSSFQTLEVSKKQVISGNIQHILDTGEWLGWDSQLDKGENPGEYTQIDIADYLTLSPLAKAKPFKKEFQVGDFGVTLWINGDVTVGCTTLYKPEVEEILEARKKFLNV